MESLHYLQNAAFDYYSQIPEKTLKASIYSFGATFLLGMVFGNTQRTITSGTLAAIASLTYGVVTPLFKKILEKDQLSYGEELARKLTAISAAVVTMNLLNIDKTVKISFLGLIFIFAFTKEQTPINQSVRFFII